MPRQPPQAARIPVVDHYHGVAVADPYRWMEASGSADFRGWMEQQAAFARQALDALPGRSALRDRLEVLSQATVAVNAMATGGSRLFYLATEPGRDSARLMVRDGPTGAPRVLLDPATLSTPGRRQALGDITPSPDGRHVAVNVAPGGSEQSVLHIVDVATGRLLPERFDKVYGGGWTVAWLDDGTRFFLVRNPGEGDAYQRTRVFLHRLGQPVESDVAVFGHGVHPDLVFEDTDYSYFLLDPGSPFLVAVTVPGVANQRHFFVADRAEVLAGRGRWRRLASPSDQWFRGALLGRHLFVMSQQDAPGRKLLRIDLADPKAVAQTVIPSGRMLLDDATVARDGLYLKTTEMGVSHLWHVPRNGAAPREVALPVDGSIREMVGQRSSEGILVKLDGWTNASRVLRVAAGASRTQDSIRDTGLLPPSPADFSAVISEVVQVPGHDGTRIPMTLIHRRDLSRDGQRPTLLMAYGAYGLPREPRFDPLWLAWIERGGLIAVAHVRGGGEGGAAWHAAGHLLTKSNTLRDVVSCAEALIGDRYTRPGKLAVQGSSAGGLAAGGALTERPDLFVAAHLDVPVTDLLRSETTPNGRANAAEFGTVADRYQFLAMHSVSPLHRVTDGVPYPAVVLTTGINDPRVPSWEPAKMAARLQAATTSNRPVLLRVDMDAGHGFGVTRTQRVDQVADVWSFLLAAMEEPGFSSP